jgi:hypothetical protein
LIHSGIDDFINDASWFPKGQPQQRIEKIVPLHSNTYESNPVRDGGFCQSVDQSDFLRSRPNVHPKFLHSNIAAIDQLKSVLNFFVLLSKNGSHVVRGGD